MRALVERPRERTIAKEELEKHPRGETHGVYRGGRGLAQAKRAWTHIESARAVVNLQGKDARPRHPLALEMLLPERDERLQKGREVSRARHPPAIDFTLCFAAYRQVGSQEVEHGGSGRQGWRGAALTQRFTHSRGRPT